MNDIKYIPAVLFSTGALTSAYHTPMIYTASWPIIAGRVIDERRHDL